MCFRLPFIFIWGTEKWAVNSSNRVFWSIADYCETQIRCRTTADTAALSAIADAFHVVLVPPLLHPHATADVFELTYQPNMFPNPIYDVSVCPLYVATSRVAPLGDDTLLGVPVPSSEDANTMPLLVDGVIDGMDVAVAPVAT
jgi:hypothetical protein